MHGKISALGLLGTLLISLSVSSTTTVALAQAPSARLEIVGFNRVSDNPKNYSAEVCGIVHRSGTFTAGQADLIRLILDRETNSPRVYYTYAGQTGIFCSLVVTLAGTVEAAIEDGSNSSATAHALVGKMKASSGLSL